MRYGTDKTAQELIFDYTKIVELQFMFEAFKVFCTKEVPERTSKHSFLCYVDRFHDEEIPRIIIKKNAENLNMFSINSMDTVLWNTITDFQEQVLVIFTGFVNECINSFVGRVSTNKLLHQLETTINEAVRKNILLLDQHRGCLF